MLPFDKHWQPLKEMYSSLKQQSAQKTSGNSPEWKDNKPADKNTLSFAQTSTSNIVSNHIEYREGNSILPYNSLDDINREMKALNSFIIASGSMECAKNVVVNYTIRDVLGNCFSIDLFVQKTNQSWTIFVPSSDAVRI